MTREQQHSMPSLRQEVKRIPELEINRDWINQVCSVKLQELGVRPDPYQLHSLQLMNWGLEVAGLRYKPSFHEELLEEVTHLNSLRPSTAHRLMFEYQEDATFQEKDLRDKDPETVAHLLLAESIDRMVDTAP